jgi:tetratricopeptide (TPR) repeat protein
VLTVAGMCFGVIVGWLLASLDVNRMPVAVPQVQTAAPASDDRRPPPLDDARVQALTTILKNDPRNAGAALQLGNTYFEADQFDEAAKWFQEAMRLDPKDAEASTQLGMTYFFTKGPDPALAQFEHSLKISPNHPGTLLKKGIVLYRGKQDLSGAAAAWQTLVEKAPNSPEAQVAKEGLQAVHGGRGGGTGTPPSSNQE